METAGLDQWLKNFMEENTWLVILALLPIALLQLFYFITKDPPVFLKHDLYQELPLQKKENVNHNTIFLRFKLNDERQRLGLLVGQHAIFKFTNKDGKAVFRPYTPISGVATKGHVDFIIKVYPRGEMSQYVDKLDIGDRLLMKGPKGKFAYRRNMKKAFGMLCGGTGITPMFQVIKHILSDPKDRTQISLLYANISVDDILLKRDLDKLAAQHPLQLDVFYVIEKEVPDDWTGGVGYITKDMIKKHCPAPTGNIMMLHCGPAPMNNAMKTAMDELGYSVNQQFKF